jgi:hypothetical protein
MEGLKKTLKVGILSLAVLSSGALGSQIAAANDWIFPTIGTGRGTWDTSVGLFFGKDQSHVRNLQFRSDIDLGPGVRYHTLVRSNREFNSLSGLEPHFDENYLEGYGYKEDNRGRFSASLRVGNIRYLHFPYPDSIDIFDQVPGIGDLKGEKETTGQATGYSGELLELDYAHHSGWGVHATALRWDFGRKTADESSTSHNRNDLIDNYLFYRHPIGALEFETHIGGLAVRTEPLGSRALGYNVYLGTRSQHPGFSAGVLYEKLHNQPAYTGVLMTFALDPVTKAMGSVAFDYDRSPQGIAMQIPLVAGTYGHFAKEAPKGGILVGEVKAERLRTYWQNGQARNYYEHRLSAWGDTSGKNTVAVMIEQPWYLQAEALVSPNSFHDLRKWERERQGPAQLSQSVTYQYYEVK